MYSNEIEGQTGLKGKTLSMPTGKSLNRGSKMSSNMTNASSVSLNVYAEPAEKLDWSV